MLGFWLLSLGMDRLCGTQLLSLYFRSPVLSFFPLGHSKTMLLLLGRQERQLRAVPDLVLELLSKTPVCVKTSFGFTGPQLR